MKLRHIPLDGSQRELFVPDSEWAPWEGPLPMLEGEDVGIDTETRDASLARGSGPGWVYDDGWLAGVSVAWTGGQLYVPVRHPDSPCRPLGEVIEWIEHLHRHCVCHYFNAGYDLGWLAASGLRVWPSRLHCASVSSVMLDENRYDNSLTDCCARASIPGKDETLLEAAAVSYGVHPKTGLWQMPARFVGPYAEQDAASTLALSLHNLPLIEAEGQLGAYDTEVRLVPCLHHMRRRGIRISEQRIHEGQRRLRHLRDQSLEQIRTITGIRADMKTIRSPDGVGSLFQAAGIDTPRTPKTKKPSVTRTWLEEQRHPLATAVRGARRHDDLAEKFLGTYLLESLHLGRIHAEIHQLRDEEGGTRTHRLSYSNPPLQQSPARPDNDGTAEDREAATIFRSCFLPEDGTTWFSPDYSGQEPRFVVHLAAACGIKSGQEMAARWRDNPRLDYHQTVADLIGLSRAAAKDLNQGLAYGIGVDKFAMMRHISRDEAEEMVAVYHERLPYPRALARECERLAKARGWVRLVDGARLHFDSWQPTGKGREIPPIRGYDAARARWPNANLERAFCHKAMNGCAQGGSARQMKRAMVACHEMGLTPMLQMHDELSFSVSELGECLKVEQAMLEAVSLQVPMVVDCDCGPDWGHAKTKMEEWFR